MKHTVTLVTCPSARVARRIARALVEERLAACVTVVGGAVSIYRWKGKRCEDRETLLVIKSTKLRGAALARRVKELHPYEVPEVLALPVAGGDARYLGWIDEGTR